mmetsp:Transcript_5902/g.21533  ORF Transcript_5902/g.21533 Transcript_5902/m.21533 type:complete len:208 (+) Transcript_5902:204-827(+)
MSNPPPLPKPSGCVSGLAPPRPSASVPDDREDPPPPSLPSRSARRCAIASFSVFRFLFGDPPGETPIPPPPLAAPFADLALSPCPRFDDTVPPLSNSSVFAGVDGEIGGVDPRAPRFAPAPPTPFFGESGADATERSSSPALASAADSWNHRARHCCAVLPVSILLMLLHRGPSLSCNRMSSWSSVSFHASFFTVGSRCLRHRPMHC